VGKFAAQLISFSVENVKVKINLVALGEKKITRTSPGRYERYAIYLPSSLNYVWRGLHDRRAKVRFYIEIPEGVSEGVESGARIPLGERRVTRLVKSSYERYVVYLPPDLNYLWRELHNRGAKVKVYVEIPEEQVVSRST